MCGGGGGILGGLTGLLFGKQENKAVDLPEPAPPAPPAPSRKQDTGALVKVGETGAADERLSGKRRTGLSALGRSASSGLGL